MWSIRVLLKELSRCFHNSGTPSLERCAETAAEVQAKSSICTDKRANNIKINRFIAISSSVIYYKDRSVSLKKQQISRYLYLCCKEKKYLCGKEN